MIGNSGGKAGRSGRKSKAEELGLQSLLESAFGPEKREQVIRRLAEIASGPDDKSVVSAASLLLAYAFGKPHETIKATIKHEEYEVDIGGTIAHDNDTEQPEYVQ